MNLKKGNWPFNRCLGAIDPQVIKATLFIMLAIIIVGGTVMILGNSYFNLQMEEVSQNLIEKRILENSELLSRRLSEYKLISYSLVRNSEVQQMRIWQTLTGYEWAMCYLLAKNRFQNTTIYDDHIKNLYACFPDVDMVFDGGVYTLSEYNILTPEEQTHLNNGTYLYITSQELEKGIAIERIQIGAAQSSQIDTLGYLVMELRPDTITEIIGIANDLKDESVCLLDADGQIIYCQGGLSTAQWRRMMYGTGTSGYQFSENIEYYITQTSVGMLGWQYYLAVPRINLTENARLSANMIFIIICIVILALILGVSVAQWIFLPFKKLYRLVLGRNNSHQLPDRIASLSQAVNKIISENKDLSEFTDRNMPLLREKMLMKLVMQNTQEAIDIQQLAGISLVFPHECFNIVIVYYHIKKELDTAELVCLEIVREFWRERLNDIGTCYTVQHLPNQFFIVLNRPRKSETAGSLEDWFNKQIQAFEQEYQGRLTGGISTNKSTFNELNLAFREANQALDRQLVMDPGYFHSYSQTKDSGSMRVAYPVNLTERMIHSVFNEDAKTLKVILDEIRVFVACNPSDNEFSVRQVFVYISSMLFQRMTETDQGIGLADLFDKTMESLLAADHIDGYILTLTEYVFGLMQTHQRFVKKQLQTGACLIRDYIDRHFQEHLTPEGIAQQFQISMPYLYKLMKDEFDVTPGNYLNIARAREASRLLRESNMLVHDIRIFCGYENEQSFLNNFKKQYGCSPTKFRKSWINTMPKNTSSKCDVASN